MSVSGRHYIVAYIFMKSLIIFVIMYVDKQYDNEQSSYLHPSNKIKIYITFSSTTFNMDVITQKTKSSWLVGECLLASEHKLTVEGNS